MSRIVRASKFRHVYADPEKPDNCYLDLELSPVTGDHNYIRGNSKFFCVSARGGGGPVLVLPYEAKGKLPRGYPLINGHSAAVYDTAWCPANDNLLATGSDDTTVKLWAIPEGGLKEHLKEPVATLTGHGKPVSLLQWHPSASGSVLASVGKEPTVRIWDVEKATNNITLTGFEGLVQDIAWNYDGSKLGTSDKAKSAKIHDPRSGSVIAEWKPHGGGKPFKMLFLGATNQIVTVGFTAQSKREIRVWDAAAGFEKAAAVQELDQAAGVLMPFYDEDTRMLYLTGKGDGNVRYFEMVDSDPWIHFLAEHRTNVSTKGADFLPKRACNAMRCEVARMLKLTNDSVEPISFIVPRKETSFQEDIFPDAYAGVASLTGDEWFGGKNAAPKRVSMDPAKGGVVRAGGAFAGSIASTPAVASPAPVKTPAASPVESAPSPVVASTPAAATPAPTPAPAAAAGGAGSEEVDSLRKELAAAKARIAELEASEAKLKKALAALSA